MKKYIICALMAFGCADLQRSVESGYSKYDPSEKKMFKVSEKNMKAEGNEGLQKIFDSNQIQHLERSLQTKAEKEQYAQILPWLKTDDEKREFLSLNNVQERKSWIDQKKIMLRANENSEEFKELVDSQDIAIGMPMELVRKSWGDPSTSEVAGNPIYKNERWRYVRQVASSDGYHQEKRVIYFEGGRVVGWETE